MISARRRPLVLAVEGNIGAGKSTFLRLVGQYMQAHLVFEPHTRWQDVQGENLLDYFYKDPQRWAYAFQTYAFVTRVLSQEQGARDCAGKPLQILERSVFSDRYCFAKNCYELGFMNNLEWKLYQEWFAWLVDGYTVIPDAFIYMRTDPVVCHQRLVKRRRSEEATVSLEYLNLLHIKHEDWLVHHKDLASSVAKVPVLVLACNDDFEHTKDNAVSHARAIVDFLEKNFAIQPQETLYSSFFF